RGTEGGLSARRDEEAPPREANRVFATRDRRQPTVWPSDPNGASRPETRDRATIHRDMKSIPPAFSSLDAVRSLVWDAVGVLPSPSLLIVVLVAGLALRLVLLAQTAVTPLRIVDEHHYAELATSIAEGRGFAWASGEPTSIRPPMYPLFIAALWWMTGTHSPQ